MYDDYEIMYTGSGKKLLRLGIEHWGNSWSQPKQVVIIGEMRNRLTEDLTRYCLLSCSIELTLAERKSMQAFGYWTPTPFVARHGIITLEAMLCHESVRLREYAIYLIAQLEAKANRPF